MAWLAVNKNGQEVMSRYKPKRSIDDKWKSSYTYHINGECLTEIKETILPPGTIKLLINKELTWADEPVERI